MEDLLNLITPAEAQVMLDAWAKIDGGPWSGHGFAPDLAHTVIAQGTAIERLREALSWYDDPSSQGDVARAALSKKT